MGPSKGMLKATSKNGAQAQIIVGVPFGCQAYKAKSTANQATNRRIMISAYFAKTRAYFVNLGRSEGKSVSQLRDGRKRKISGGSLSAINENVKKNQRITPTKKVMIT